MLFDALLITMAVLLWGAVYLGGVLGVAEACADPEEEWMPDEEEEENEEAELLGMKCVCGVDGGHNPGRRDPEEVR